MESCVDTFMLLLLKILQDKISRSFRSTARALLRSANGMMLLCFSRSFSPLLCLCQIEELQASICYFFRFVIFLEKGTARFR
jgi:hypothetical protein